MSEPEKLPPRPPPRRPTDLEIKDPHLIFGWVWEDLERKHGRDNLRLPRECIWLGGAPGAGKGTNTPFVTEARGITAPPIVVSSLLTSPTAVAIKNAGGMVGDRDVIELLFEELLQPQYHDGVLIDGFPRTTVQAECLKLFYQAMLDLHISYRNTPLARFFRKPMFRIVLLFVSEEVSIARQLKRGKEIWDHNRQVLQSGVGTLLEERTTDIDEDLCRKRYKTFKETTYDALKSLEKLFHFHFIDAEGDLHDVQEKILRELAYQSSLELSPEVHEVIRAIPVAGRIATHARQDLVERLEDYVESNKALFERVVKFVETKMIPIIRTHAISGHARINSEDELLDDMDALRMMIDVFSERGYHAVVDIHRMEVPIRVNPDTWEIICRTKKVYRIEVRYQPWDIRRGH